MLNAQLVKQLPSTVELLAIQDSTGLGFKNSARDDLGDRGGPAESKARGWHVHTTLLWSLESSSLVGLGDQHWLLREEQTRGRKHQRHQRAYEDKESYKWESAHRRLQERMSAETMKRIIMVGDSEAAIYLLLEYFAQAQARYVVRAARDRVLSATQAERHLGAQMAVAQTVGTRIIKVAQRQGRRARTATVTLRSMRVALARPANLGIKTAPGELAVNVV